MERRKSRQSNYAPTNVDIDYSGDSAKFEHVIRQHDYFQGQPNQSALNFSMKLRGYKNATTFLAKEPFIYPGKKSFHPNHGFVYHNETDKVNSTLKDFQFNKFRDQSPEKNQGLVLSMFDKGFGVYQNTFWSQNLGNGCSKTATNKSAIAKRAKGGKPPLANEASPKLNMSQ